MTSTYHIAAYCSSFMGEKMDPDCSIEKQEAAIKELVEQKFPGSSLTLFADRDCSGNTFQQCEGFQAMIQGFISDEYDILVMKSLSRISGFNNRGLMALEELRDLGVRIISIDDGIDFPTAGDWLKIQLQFLVSSIPVEDVS